MKISGWCVPRRLILTLVFLGRIGVNLGIPVPGGVSQVGFSIYQNKEEAERARNPHNKNNRVIVTYSINHPPAQNSHQATDISKDFGAFGEPSYKFEGHEGHRKQMEMFRLAQVEGAAVGGQGRPAPAQTFETSPLGGNSHYPQYTDDYHHQNREQAPSAVGKYYKDYSTDNSPKRYSYGVYGEQETTSTMSTPMSMSIPLASFYSQPQPKPKLPVISYNVNHQHAINANDIESLDLKEALDTSYPLQYY